jgi:hypothetical protein
MVPKTDVVLLRHLVDYFSRHSPHIDLRGKQGHLLLSPQPFHIPSACTTPSFPRLTSRFETSIIRVKVLCRVSNLVIPPIMPPYWPFKTNTRLPSWGHAINNIGHTPSTFRTAASGNDRSFLSGSSLKRRITCDHRVYPSTQHVRPKNGDPPRVIIASVSPLKSHPNSPPILSRKLIFSKKLISEHNREFMKRTADLSAVPSLASRTPIHGVCSLATSW